MSRIDENKIINKTIMTDKQKEAIEILVKLRVPELITSDEFYALLEFIIRDTITYVPVPSLMPTQPLGPYYRDTTGEITTEPPFKITCSMTDVSKT